jgi:hypothetical protein
MRPALAVTMLLAACSDREPAAPPPPPASAGERLYAELCAARAVPATPPASPRQHLHALGEVAFATAGQGEHQRAELWLAGPSRMRFQASAANGNRNVFLVDGPDAGWVSTARDPKKWEEFRSPEVARETLLRWEVLRFPWGWREVVAAGGGDARAWTRRADEGEIVIEVGDDLRPRAASYAGVEVTLADWRPADDAPWQVARSWSWTGPSGGRSERYEQLGAQWLLFDDWFRPPDSSGAPDRSFRAVGASESCGVVRATLWTTATAPEHPGASGVQWWLCDGRRAAGVLLAADAPAPEQAAAEPHAHWLRWTFASDPAGALKAAEEIGGIARAAGLRVLGPVWLSEPDRELNSVTILLPVEPQDGR